MTERDNEIPEPRRQLEAADEQEKVTCERFSRVGPAGRWNYVLFLGGKSTVLASARVILPP